MNELDKIGEIDTTKAADQKTIEFALKSSDTG